MQKMVLAFLVLTLSSCGGSVSVYNRLGNLRGSVRAEPDTAVILDAEGNQVGTVEGREVRDIADAIVGQVIKREGLVLIEGEEATGYLQDGTDCYDVMGYKQGRLTHTIDAEAAAGACLLLIFR
ncbi:hypothetical protein HYZ99_05020 [Candidatus Peregrinibacteria bacterium]|nr:hypothetical protein [Candidatus Peregrinibacteria bacterium]